MAATVYEIASVIDALAPHRLAASWDNVGLQVGDPRWPVSLVWVALDPLPGVIQEAVAAGVNLLVTHHPLFFRPIGRLDLTEPSGEIVRAAIEGKMAVYCAHTNLDTVHGGLNDMLASRLELTSTIPLTPPEGEHYCKLVVFVPAGHEADILSAIADTPAGQIGRYGSCSFRTEGIGTFVPEAEARPFSGNPGETSSVQEIRVEIRVHRHDVESVLDTIRAVHPYDEMAYDLYPLETGVNSIDGLGRVGELAQAVPLNEFAAYVGRRLHKTFVSYIGKADRLIRKVALCSGSGSSLLPDFYRSGADVYVSGDLGYHHARDIEMRNKCAVNIGHFASEHLFIEPFRKNLQRALKDRHLSVTVAACKTETDPFQYTAVEP